MKYTITADFDDFRKICKFGNCFVRYQEYNGVACQHEDNQIVGESWSYCTPKNCPLLDEQERAKLTENN